MNREIKFRAWDAGQECWLSSGTKFFDFLEGLDRTYWKENAVIMQFTGLKDKNGLQELYEGDIIDRYGNIIGNCWETPNLVKEKTSFLIQGFGDKNWGATYQKAMECGFKDTQRYADTDEVRKLD